MTTYTNHLRKVKVSATPFLGLLLCCYIIPALSGVVHAKSLYLLSNIDANPSPVEAWDVLEDGTLKCRKKTTTPNFGNGAVAVTIDSESNYFFITHANSNKIQIFDGTTMQGAGVVIADGAKDLAGIAYDHKNNRVYCIDRHTPNLYVFNWSATWQQLTAASGSPVQLPGAMGFGIALNERTDVLYVANSSKTVRRYLTSDWTPLTDIVLSRNATVLAIDADNQLLYSGAAHLKDEYLLQYDLLFNIEREIYIDLTFGATGLAINDDKEWVYISAWSWGGGHNGIRAYDKNLDQKLYHWIGKQPSGLAISSEKGGYNPLGLDVDIVSGAGSVDGRYFAYPGDTITYQTSFRNRKNSPITGVSVVNTLSQKAVFVRAIPVVGDLGSYDPATHSYKLFVPVLNPGERRAYQLETKLKSDLPPDITATHVAAITSNELSEAKDSVDVTMRHDFKLLNVAKTIVAGANEVGGAYYAQAGNDILYELEVSNKVNPWPVTGVSVVDELPRALQFVRFEGPTDAVYDQTTHTVRYGISQLDSGAVYRLRFAMHVPENTLDNTVVINSFVADSEQTDPASAQIGFMVAPTYDDLALSVKLMNVPESGTPPIVAPGQPLIYQITTKNTNALKTVTNLVVSDQFSLGLHFVSAEPASGFLNGQSYSWTYPQLGPGQSVVSVLMLEVARDSLGGVLLATDVRARSNETPAVIVHKVVQTGLGSMVEAVSAINGAGDTTLSGQIGCVVPGESFRYLIRVANTANVASLHNVTVLDQLPPQVEFVSSQPDGLYNPNGHFVLLVTPELESQQERVLEIRVRVPEGMPIGTLFRNQTAISSQEFGQSDYAIDMQVCEKVIEAVNTKTVYNAAYPSNKIIVTMDLPSSIFLSHIDASKPFVLTPGSVPAITGKTIIGGVDGAVRLIAHFEPGPVRAVTGSGTVLITMQGYLVGGGRFGGSGEIIFP